MNLNSAVAACFAWVLISALTAVASPVVIAGSELESPPSFHAASYYQITANLDRAFPFTVAAGGPYRVDELQVAAYRIPGVGGFQANFSLHSDAGGAPGAELVDFTFPSIPTAATVLTAAPNGDAWLQSGAPYWIVGETPQGQVNWNLGDGAFGTAAFRVGNGAWTVNNSNVSAFAILGAPIPEPAPAAMCIGAGVAGFVRRRRLASSVNL